MSKIRVIQRFKAREVLDMTPGELMFHIRRLCCYLTGLREGRTSRSVYLRRDFGMNELEVEELVLLLGTYFSTDVSLYDPDVFDTVNDVSRLVRWSAEQTVRPASSYKVRKMHQSRYHALYSRYVNHEYI